MANTSPTTLLGLTDVGNGENGATEVVKYLLEAVGRSIVSFQRNTHVSYMVAERARDIIEAINECIADVENSETGDWTSYDKYSEAIDPLEEMLFKLLALADDEKEQYLAKTGSAVECVSSARIWADKRNEITNTLNEFYTRQELVNLVPDTQTRESDHQEAQFHDDKTLLEELGTQISDILGDPNELPTYVNDIKTPLDELQNAVTNDSSRAPAWLMVLTTQTSMLIHGVLEIVKVTTDIETRNHLKSKPVWDSASALINVLNENKSQENSPDDANNKYNAFLDILVALANVALPESYVKLMKQVGHIRRPFQAQAITIVMLCRTLAVKFSSLDKSAVTIENFDSLESAFNKTLVALEDAAAQAGTELKTFDMSNFENHDGVKAFGDAEALIKGSFQTLNLGAEWTKKQTDLSTAVRRDKERLTKLQDILDKGPSNAPEKVKVNVSIHETLKNETELGSTSVDGERTMRLSALRWSVAEVLEPDNKKRARTAGTFFQRSENQWSKITAHSTLERVAGNGSEVSLKLVLA